MPKTQKPTPSAPQSAPAETPNPAMKKRISREEANHNRASEIQRVRTFLARAARDIELFETINLIQRRSCSGNDGPIENFIMELILDYGIFEDRGEAMTVEHIEHELDELRENMEDTLGEAYFIANRYQRPVTRETSYSFNSSSWRTPLTKFSLTTV